MSAKPSLYSSILSRKDMLSLRAQLYSEIRNFFKEEFLEVETPVRIPTPALEDYIEAEPSGNSFLRTSPELHMKRLLAEGIAPIYQLGPCFRHGESGKRHLPEFTMLEWYRLNADYKDILADAEKFFKHVIFELTGDYFIKYKDRVISFANDWQQLTVSEAFSKYTDITMEKALELDCFEEYLVSYIEPNLGNEKPCVLMEYPAGETGLSKPMAHNNNLAERFEIYVCGLELANACTEITDYNEQKKRFEKCAELRRKDDRLVYDIDIEFLEALKRGMPSAAGIAIGIDRLMMLISGAEEIQAIVSFC